METPEEIALRDAALTTGTWTAKAKRLIDADFGEGYASAHPELVAAWIKTAAMSYLADRLAIAFERAASELADAWSEAQP